MAEKRVLAEAQAVTAKRPRITEEEIDDPQILQIFLAATAQSKKNRRFQEFILLALKDEQERNEHIQKLNKNVQELNEQLTQKNVQHAEEMKKLQEDHKNTVDVMEKNHETVLTKKEQELTLALTQLKQSQAVNGKQTETLTKSNEDHLKMQKMLQKSTSTNSDLNNKLAANATEIEVLEKRVNAFEAQNKELVITTNNLKITIEKAKHDADLYHNMWKDLAGKDREILKNTEELLEIVREKAQKLAEDLENERIRSQEGLRREDKLEQQIIEISKAHQKLLQNYGHLSAQLSNTGRSKS